MLKSKTRILLIKIAVVVTTFLFGFMMCVTAITNENRTAVNNYLNVKEFSIVEPESTKDLDKEYFKSKYDNLADLIAAGKDNAELIEAEGAVLLKNDNGALPLDVDGGEKKISLFGTSSVDPAYGGKGSAQTGQPLPPVTPKEGFTQAGFEVNGALLSRCKVFVLKALSSEELTELLTRALKDERGFGEMKVEIAPELVEAIANKANGDARSALSTLEMAVLNGEFDGEKTIVTAETVEQCTQRKSLLYDKSGEQHYNLISALHKSMRNSDPDAAVYWLARMLEAGEEPLYIARRLIRFSSEDVGLADPRAVELAVAVYQACHFIGMPECSVNLTQLVVYLSLAPKSNAMEVAYNTAQDDAVNMLAEPVPLAICNAPTKLMRELEYGKGYKYVHDYKDKLTAMQCLPDSLKNRTYYRPTEEGLEGRFKTRLESIKEWKKAHSDDK